MEKENARKYNIILIFVTLLIGFIGFIIFNSVISKGKDVLMISYNPNIDIMSYKGYEVDGGNITYIDSDEHYMTFNHTDKADGMLVIFNKNPEVDSIYVWYMTYDGGVIEEESIPYDRNDRFLELSDLPGGTSLISLGIESDYVVREVISSDSYIDNTSKKIILVVTLVVMALFFILFWKLRFFEEKFNTLYDNVSKCFADKKNFAKGVLTFFGIVLISALASFLIVFVLQSLDISVMGSSVRLNYKSFLLLFFGFGFILTIVFKRDALKEKPEMVGLLAILSIGLMYSLIEPTSVGVGWDDEIHYDNANRIAHFVDVKKSLADYEFYNMYEIVATQRYSYDEESSKDINSIYDYLYKEGYVTDFSSNFINLNRIVYLPMAVGLIFARGLCLPYHICIIVGRLFNLLFLVLMCYLSMKRLKSGKFLVPLVMLIPTNVFIASGYSYDTWLTGWIVYGYSVLFSERQELDEPMKVSSQILIPLSFFIATLSKPVYFVFALPAFFITFKKFKKKWRGLLYYTSLLAAMSFPFLYVMISAVGNAGEGDTRGGSDVNAALQLQEAAANVPRVVGVIANFLKDYLNPFKQGVFYSMYNGYNGQFKGGLIVILAVFVGALICHEQSDKRSFPIWYRIGALVLYLSVGIIVSFSMYVYYTPVGADHVAGCQWRYLIPALYPVIFILSRIPIKTYVLDKVGRFPVYITLSAIMLLMSCYALWLGCISYY